MPVAIHKGYVPGAIGRIAELHARYYFPLVGFSLPFESRVACELSEFCNRYDDERDGAHLRRFIASDGVRGKGVGANFLATAMRSRPESP